MNQRPRVAFQTLGCKLNQYESDSLATQFQEAGYQLVSFAEPAEAYIVNSCTVTNKADRKSRNVIYRAQRQAAITGKSDSLVIVTGCFSGQYAQEIAAQKNTYIVGNERKNSIFQIVEAHRQGEILDQSLLKADPFAYQPAAPIFHTRSMIKIQDGCDNFCTFCIIPYVRGRAVSRPLDSIIKDVHANLAIGYREIVITGVNISRYNSDDYNFSALLERILSIEGDFRLRISSLEPDQLDERFFALLEHPRMTPHLHLCLQSGSDKILLRMRRQYTVGQYLSMVERIRSRISTFNFTTDIIVGFPDEESADFAATCRVVRQVGFSHVHTFPYATRNGTRAERLPHHVLAARKHRRAATLRALSERLKYRYRKSLVGCLQRVLIERLYAQEGCWYQQGYGQHYVPIAIKCNANAPTNQWQEVQLTGLTTQLDHANAPILLGVAT